MNVQYVEKIIKKDKKLLDCLVIKIIIFMQYALNNGL